jgi:threonine/homoserine efflux transporter RhtA
MSIGYQLEQRGDDGTYTSAFVVIYASVAIFAFLGGMLADRCGVGMVQGCATALSGISFTILLLGALEVQVLGMVAYSFGRLLTYAMYFSNIGRRFGYQHYGLLAGFGLLVSAIVASVIQTLLFSLCVSSNEGMVRANLISISILSSAIPYTCWIIAREWREKGSAE